MSVTDISVNGLNAIRMEEGRALRAYQDCVHVWTVGYGLTNMDKGLPWRVGPGLVISEADAEWYLYRSLRQNYLPDVERSLNFDKCPKPQGACDAGLGFHFNTGGIRRASWPRELMARNLAAARASLESWNKAGGRVIGDLVRRRAHEWGIMSEENYGHLTGPVVVVPGSHGQETYHGTGDLLTALPHEPGTTEAPAKPIAAPNAITDGSTGPHVTELQGKLGVPQTGTYDDATKSAVTQLQQSHPQLTADGTVGPATQAAIDRSKNLADATNKIVKTLPAGGATYIGAHEFISAHAGNILLVLGGLALASVVGYIVYQYRHDLMAKVNSALGRIVP